MSGIMILTLFSLMITFHSHHASVKTGAGISPSTTNVNCDDLNTLTSPVWWFNWDTMSTFEKMSCSPHRTDIEFVPMIWGWYNQDLSAISIPADTTTILGFNKPNVKDQANLQPTDAVDGWKAIQSAFPDKILVSPSATPCSGGECIDNFGSQEAWFDEFFRICNGSCRVDYMAVHLYWCYPLKTKSVNAWIGALWDIYNKYGYELWLTQFNCWDGTSVQQKAFMEEVIPVIESTDWIVKYAWFIARDYVHDSDWQLFTRNISVSTLTTLGETYNKYSLTPTSSPTSYPSSPSTDPTMTPSKQSDTTDVIDAESIDYVVSININECNDCDLNEDKINALILVALGDEVNILSTDIIGNTVIIELSVSTDSNNKLNGEYIGQQIEKQVEDEYGDVDVDVDINGNESNDKQKPGFFTRLFSNKVIMVIVIVILVIIIVAFVVWYFCRQFTIKLQRQSMMMVMTDSDVGNNDGISATKTDITVANANNTTGDRLSHITSTRDLPDEPQKDDDSNSESSSEVNDDLWDKGKEEDIDAMTPGNDIEDDMIYTVEGSDEQKEKSEESEGITVDANIDIRNELEEGHHGQDIHIQNDESGNIDDIYVKENPDDKDNHRVGVGTTKSDEAQNEKLHKTKGDGYYDEHYDEMRKSERNEKL